MEVASAYAIASATLGRMAEDLFLWVTAEFAFVSLPDRFCGTSSIMPQKKNPDALEAVKSTSSQSLGALVSIVTAERGPTGFPILERRHTQDLLWEIGRSLAIKLGDMHEIVEGMDVHAERMAISAESNWAQVTDLASSLVVETGIDWRRAHRIVGGFVRLAIDAGLRPQTVGLDTLDEAAEQVTGEPSGLGEEAFAAAMSARAFVERRTMIGAPGPVAVRRESAAAAQAVAQDRERLSAVRASVDEAATDLESAIDAIVSSGA
jgi:argininosuccinate lyase